MDEHVLKSGKKRVIQWIAVLSAVLVLVILAVWLLLFQYNRFFLSVRLLGEDSIVMDYEMQFQDPGAEVYLVGTKFWTDGIPIEEPNLKVTGQVEDVLGRYTLTYTASLGKLQGQAQRLVMVSDTQSPVITLTEDASCRWRTAYTAIDNYDGDITDRVRRVETPGLITYSVADSSGNPAYLEQVIPESDTLEPEILLDGGEHYQIPAGILYEEPGYTALDNADGDLTAQVQIDGEVDWIVPGVYSLIYSVADSSDNVVNVTRNVEVTAMPRPEIQWPEAKTVYLTFDDGPGPYTLQLLDVLDAYGVKATFFVTDSGYDDVLREISNRGHSIGIHTVSHNYSEVYASPEAYFSDLQRMQKLIYEKTGVYTTLLRFPGGSSNTVSRGLYKGIMTILSEAVQDAGYQYFDWNVDSNDAGGAKTAKTVYRNVIDGIAAERVSVVLQHDIHGFSVAAVADIIQWGLDHGYDFRALTQDSPGFHHELNN